LRRAGRRDSIGGITAEAPPMRPKQPDLSETPELFRARLENLIGRRHPLARLAELIDWRAFEQSFGVLYQERAGRLLRERREDRCRAKLYSLHAPEVECFGKSKALVGIMHEVRLGEAF
jgi:hypothetical protein